MGSFLLRLVLWLCAHTRIATYTSEHPDFATLVYDAAQAHEVPQVLLLAVGLHESGLGSNTRTRHPWGVLAPALRAYCASADTRCNGDALHDQIEASAHVLRVGFGACGSWSGSLRRYYSGLCWSHRPRLTRTEARVRARRHRFYQQLRGYQQAVQYEQRVMGTARRLEAHAVQEDAQMAASLRSLRSHP
jgi:hypothetical protein